MAGPKPYVPKLSRTWFLEKPGYRKYLVRELTSVPTVLYLFYLVYFFQSFGPGGVGYAHMVELSQNPAVILFHVVALAASLYHSITWWNLTPKAMPPWLRLGEYKIPPPVISVMMGYGPWLTVTALLILYVLIF